MPKEFKIGYVKKDYTTNEGINLPKNITHHRIDKKHLFIAPEKASWITVNGIGKNFVHYFKKGYSIKDAINKMHSKNFKMDTITSELRSFLIDIEKNGFLEDAKVKEEKQETSFQIYLTRRCNLNCIHCYIDAGENINNEISTEEFMAAIDECGKISKSRIVFTGGEPLLHSDFFKLAERAKSNSLKVVLFTNGTLLSAKMVPKLEKCVDEIQFSLDGATPVVNDSIRGKGVYNKVCKAIQLLKNTKIKLKLSIVLMPQNIDDFRKNTEKFARTFEDVEMKFSFAINEGRANKSFKFKSESVGDKIIHEILKILYEKKLKGMRKIEPNLMARNCGYGEIITISSEGDIYPCAILKHKYGNVKNDKFSEIIKKIKNDMIASNVEHLEKCPQCDLQYICLGGCRLNNITHNGNILKTYCSPQKKKDFYRKLVVRSEFDALSHWLGKKN